MRPHAMAPMLVVALAAMPLPACKSGRAQSCRRSVESGAGPADAANHFPLSVGNHWLYEITEGSGASQVALYRSEVRVTERRSVGGTTASVFTVKRLDGAEAPYELLFAKGPSGVVELGDSTAEPPLDQLYPHVILPFPLDTGGSLESYACEGLTAGDLDGDGRQDRLDARIVITVLGADTLSVPAGTFTAVKVETRTTLTIHAASGQTGTALDVALDWYVPGVGLVRSRSELSGGGVSQTQEASLVGWVADGGEGGIVAFATLATDLADANSDTQMPGRPALSFDGAGHLLAARVSTGAYGPVTIRGWVLASGGTPGPSFPVADSAGDAVAAAFNGSNHLVVSNTYGDTRVFGQRVTPAGALLDGPSGFAIWTDPTRTAYRPAVASDGAGWLVAWATYPQGVQAARVSAAGVVTAPTLLRAAATSDPLVAFGNGIYLVAWVEGASVYALRLAPDGTFLDAQPLLISASPGMKQMGSVAFDGTRFLVVWSDHRRGDTTAIGYPALDVWAARVEPDGTVLDGDPAAGGIAVNILAGEMKQYPVVASAGGAFVIAWWIEGFSPPAGIYAARVSADGALLDGPASGTGIPVGRATEYAALFVHPVVAPTARAEAIVAWVNNREVSGTRKAVEAAWLAPPALP